MQISITREGELFRLVAGDFQIDLTKEQLKAVAKVTQNVSVMAEYNHMPIHTIDSRLICQWCSLPAEDWRKGAVCPSRPDYATSAAA